MEFARLTKQGSTKSIDFDKVTGLTIGNLSLALVRAIDSEVIERISPAIIDALTPDILKASKGYTLTVRKEYNNGDSDVSTTTLDALLSRLQRSKVVRDAIKKSIDALPKWNDTVQNVHAKGTGKSSKSSTSTTGASALLALLANEKPKREKKETPATATPATA